MAQYSSFYWSHLMLTIESKVIEPHGLNEECLTCIALKTVHVFSLLLGLGLIALQPV